ncbi:MAG: DUF484 family protein [Pseudomonadota bacterium]
MSGATTINHVAIRSQILANPDLVLDDQAVMQALLSADGLAASGKVIDLRQVLVERLEDRLGALEDTHRTVIAAAYENIAGTRQVHRAILTLLEPLSFGAFLKALDGEIVETLAVDQVRFALELGSRQTSLANFPAVTSLNAGDVAEYLGTKPDRDAARATLRPVDPAQDAIFGSATVELRSEALMTLNLGPKRRKALLAFGSRDGERFGPDQATDLLEFFAGVFERAVRRFLG